MRKYLLIKISCKVLMLRKQIHGTFTVIVVLNKKLLNSSSLTFMLHCHITHQ